MSQLIEIDQERLIQTKTDLCDNVQCIRNELESISELKKKLNVDSSLLPNIAITYNNKIYEIYNYFKNHNTSMFCQEVDGEIIHFNPIAEMILGDMYGIIEQGVNDLNVMYESLDYLLEYRMQLAERIFKKKIFKVFFLRGFKSVEEFDKNIMIDDEYFVSIKNNEKHYRESIDKIFHYDFISRIPELVKNAMTDSTAEEEDNRDFFENVLCSELVKLGLGEHIERVRQESFSRKKYTVKQKKLSE